MLKSAATDRMFSRLVDLFALPNPSPQLITLKRLLLSYRSALLTTRLTHYTLSSVPLPISLDPSVVTPLPTRFRALRTLSWSTVKCIVRLPFFLVPMIVHAPIYAVGRWAGRAKMEEDRAQNKVGRSQSNIPNDAS
jgi:glycerol-3-phosphate O-acyltransferase/dihydroxyacetone phosphate acyltransferase